MPFHTARSDVDLTNSNFNLEGEIYVPVCHLNLQQSDLKYFEHVEYYQQRFRTQTLSKTFPHSRQGWLTST